MIENIFSYLNKWEIFDDIRCTFVLKNGNNADIILQQLISLSESKRNYTFKKYIATMICEHPRYAQNIIPITTCLFKANIQLNLSVLNAHNLTIISSIIKYSADILSACQALLSGNNLNQKIFNLICADPIHAIAIALENGGKESDDNIGLKEFKHLKEIAKIMNDSGMGWLYGNPQAKRSKYKLGIFCVLPQDIMHKIIIDSTNHVLDNEIQMEIITSIHKSAPKM